MSNTIVTLVREKLRAMGVKFVEDRHSRRVTDCPAPVTLLTSKKAIADYDKNYPERIACFVVRRLGGDAVTYRVFVNNRGNHQADSIEAWWTNQPEIGRTTFECHRCERHVSQVTACWACGCTYCNRCYDKNAYDNTCFQCPECGEWFLASEHYGTPLDDLRAAGFNPSTRGDAVEALCSIVKRLDGSTIVLMCADCELLLDDEVYLCRLPGTDRYSKDSARIKDLRAKMRELLDEHAGEHITIYVVRNTWRVHPVTNKPVEEIAAFRVDERGRLLQLAADAFEDMVPGLEHLHRERVEFTHPHRFEIPYAARVLLDEVEMLGEASRAKKTLSIASVEPARGLTYTLGEIPNNMRNAYMCSILETGRHAVALCLFETSGGRRPRVAGWRIEGLGHCERLRPKECRRIARSKIDALMPVPKHVEYV